MSLDVALTTQNWKRSNPPCSNARITTSTTTLIAATATLKGKLIMARKDGNGATALVLRITGTRDQGVRPVNLFRFWRRFLSRVPYRCSHFLFPLTAAEPARTGYSPLRANNSSGIHSTSPTATTVTPAAMTAGIRRRWILQWRRSFLTPKMTMEAASLSSPVRDSSNDADLGRIKISEVIFSSYVQQRRWSFCDGDQAQPTTATGRNRVSLP